MQRFIIIFYDGNELVAKILHHPGIEPEDINNEIAALPQDGNHSISAIVGPFSEDEDLPRVTLDFDNAPTAFDPDGLEHTYA